MRVMRMGADRAEHIGEFLGDGQHLGVLAHARRYRDHAADARVARPRHDRVDLAGEIRKIQVAMAVHQHRQALGFGAGFGGFALGAGLSSPPVSGST